VESPARNLLLALLLLVACSPARPQAPGLVRVDYLVKGSAGRAALTYTNATGGIEQREVVLPWELRLDVPRGTYVAVSAQSQRASGEIECQIMADLKPFKRSQSSGAYVIASCNGLAP
jgi:hypothetical protein